MSTAFKEAVPDVSDADSRTKVAFSFGTILQRYGDFSMLSILDCLRFRIFTNETSAVTLLFMSFRARMQRATSKLTDAIDTE